MWNRLKNWHSGLSKVGKVILWSVTAVLAGSAINAAASPTSNTSSQPPQKPQITQPTPKQPDITKKTVTETSSIAFSKTTVDDSSLAKGKTEVKTTGADGIKTSTYEITYTDGKQTDKKFIKDEVTTQPVAEVTAVGTYVAPAATKPNCDPNYSGGCVPNVYPSDVDCAGGSGNGPYYVQGSVYVIGTDRYGLDANHDGVACQ